MSARCSYREAIAAVKGAIDQSEALLGRTLLEDCTDPDSGEVTPVIVVTDNGAAYKSLDFARFIAGRPELEHVRTRHYAPETNGVVERFNQSIKYEHLYRHEITDGQDLTEHVEAFLDVYNRIRPHEALDFERPLEVYLRPPSYDQLDAESVQIS